MPSTASDLVLPPGAVFEARAGEITQAPTRRQVLIDRVFRATCLGFAGLIVVLVSFIVLRIAVSAIPATTVFW